MKESLTTYVYINKQMRSHTHTHSYDVSIYFTSNFKKLVNGYTDSKQKK